MSLFVAARFRALRLSAAFRASLRRRDTCCFFLNATAAEILQLCDRTRSAGQIVTEFERRFQPETGAADVEAFLQYATEGGWLEWRDPEAW